MEKGPVAPQLNTVRCGQCGHEWKRDLHEDDIAMCPLPSCRALAGKTKVMERPEALKPAEIYDTHANPRIKWSCARCYKRNDAALSVPIASVEVKHCKFCRCTVTFTLRPTRPDIEPGEAG